MLNLERLVSVTALRVRCSPTYRNQVLLLLCASLIATAVSLPATVVVRHDRSDADTLEAGARFPMVGFVPRGAGCTLIAPTWALTAAHVARSITAGSEIHFGDTRAVVKRVIVHPLGQSPKPGVPPEVDLALVEFTAPVAGVTPAALYQGNDELGQLVHIVGFGDYGTPHTGITRTDGRRRAVTNVVSDAGPVRLRVAFDAPPHGTPLEGVGSAGDSGGPALIVRNDQVFVAGISSGSMGQPNQYGLIDVYARVSGHIQWITAAMTTS